MSVLTRQQILEAKDLITEKVNVPEWGGDVFVKTLTGLQRDAFEASIVGEDGTKRNMKNMRAKLVALTVVDEASKCLFKFEDASALGKKSGKSLDRVFTIAMRLSGLSQKDVKELTADLSNGQSEDSILN